MLSDNEKDRYVNRILSGKIRLTRYHKNKEVLIITSPPPFIRYEAAELYDEIYEMADFYEVLSDKHAELILLKSKLWGVEQEKKLSELPQEIDELKVAVYNRVKNNGDSNEPRMELNIKRNNFNELYAARHMFDYMTQSGFANYIKNKFLLAKTTYLNDGLYSYESDADFDIVMGLLSKNRINEDDIRELSRTEPFRTYWYLGKDNIFLGDVALYTEEQKSICSWAKMYDSIHEAHEPPPERVINDNDALDGWLITERKKREGENFKKEAEDTFIKNPKIKNSREVFIVVDPKEGRTVDKIEKMNDGTAAIIKKQRILALKEKGEMKDLDLPDTKMELMRQANEAMNKRMKG